jgi:hypothetical protein
MHIRSTFTMVAALTLCFVAALTGCKKKANPLEVDAASQNQTQAENFPQVAAVAPVSGSELTATGRIEITFTDFMDPDSVTDAISMRNTRTGDEVDISVDYYPYARTAVVKPVSEFADSAAYLLTVAFSATNLGGQHVDGNANGRINGTPYDDYKATFHLNDPDGLARTAPPTVAYTVPGNEGGVARDVVFKIAFAGGPMDTSSLATSHFHLYRGNDEEEIERLNLGDDFVEFQLRDGGMLEWGTRYTFEIDGGEVEAASELSGEDEYLLVLDTDGDGAEEIEPSVRWSFVVEDSGGVGPDIPPHVVEGSIHFYDDHFALKFDRAMDVATFTSTNIQARDAHRHIPGTILADEDSTGFRYFYQRETYGDVSVWISMYVTDAQGTMLDGNGNGVGGEVDYDDWVWTPPTGTRLFFDDMEGGFANWIADPPWGLTATDCHSANHSATDSPQGLYGEDVDASMTLASPLDFPPIFAEVQLIFYHKLNVGSGAYCLVEGWSDQEARWDYLRSYSSYDELEQVWVADTLSLSRYIGHTGVRIRFRFQSYRSDGDGWYIDDVSIEVD